MKYFIILSFISSMSFAKNCEDVSNYKDIEKTELKKLVDDKDSNSKVFLVDVNSKESYKEKKIGQAIHYYSVKDAFAKKLPSDKAALIVAYCGGPQCTAWQKAAIDACKAGYTNIKHFKGGISGWTGT